MGVVEVHLLGDLCNSVRVKCRRMLTTSSFETGYLSRGAFLYIGEDMYWPCNRVGTPPDTS